jgi:hypothetical protein
LELVICNEAISIGVSLQRAIDLGPLLAPYSALARPQHLWLQPRTQFPCRDFPAADAYTGAQIVAIDLQWPAVLPHSAHQQMNVRIVRVVMIDRDPLKFSVEVVFHLADEPPHMVAEIEAISILRRHDESPHELIALLPVPDRGQHVDVFTLRVEAESLGKFLLRAWPR